MDISGTEQGTTSSLALGRHPHIPAALALAILVLLIYANSFSAALTLDNKLVLLKDSRIHAINLRNLNLIFTRDYWWPTGIGGLYRPLTTLSYQLNYAAFHNGAHPAAYHAVNLVLHWANALLVYALGLCLFRRSSPALLMAGVFAAHPIATEAVTNIVGRADLFATASVLGGLLLYIRSTHAAGAQKRPWLWALSATTLLGVFMKETAVTVLAAIALYDAITWRERRLEPWKSRIAGYLAVAPPLIFMACVRFFLYRSLPRAEFPFVDNPLTGADFWTARLTALKVLGKYFYLLFWPRTLSSDYSYNQIPLVHWPLRTWEDWKTVAALAVVAIVLTVAALCYRRSRAVFFLALFFFATLLPASNLVILSGSIMAERFLYLPLAGFAGCLVAAAFSAAHALRRPAAATWLVALLLAPYGARTFARNFDWQDELHLSESALQASPHSFKTHLQYASAISENNPRNPRLDEAIRHTEIALAMLEPLPITDQRAVVFYTMGGLYLLKGDHTFRPEPGAPDPVTWYEKSLEVLTRGVRVDRAIDEAVRREEMRRGRSPGDVGNSDLYKMVGLCYMRLRNYDKALLAFEYMRKLSPHTPDPYLLLAQLYVATGRLERAAVTLAEVVIMDNHQETALTQLRDVYRRLGQPGCAMGAPRLAVGATLAEWGLDGPCTVRREHVCAAYAGLTQVFLDSQELSFARRAREMGKAQFGCRYEPAANPPPVPAGYGPPAALLVAEGDMAMRAGAGRSRP